MVLQFRDVLAETERLSFDELQAYQQQLIEPLLLHARQHVPFYAQRLARVFPGGKLDLSRFHEIPILTRAQAQANVKALAALDLPPHVGPVETEETSGSTGRPFVHRRNGLVTIANLGADRSCAALVGFRRQQDDGDFYFATSRTRAAAQWRNACTGGGRDIQACIISSTCGRTPMCRSIGCWSASHTISQPIRRLFWLWPSGCRRRGVSLRFERINSIATAMSDEIRQVCREVFGAPPIDQYGAQEVGLIACECAVCGNYHVSAEAMRVEILRDDGTPCAPGETGRVVVTSFYNYAMPFIRYEIGDYAVAGPPRSNVP